jgi:hypothetical protein
VNDPGIEWGWRGPEERSQLAWPLARDIGLSKCTFIQEQDDHLSNLTIVFLSPQLQ